MTKKEEQIINEIFSSEQGKLIKRAIIHTEELGPHLSASVMRIGNEVSYLFYGKDPNGHVQYLMLGTDGLKQVQKFKPKGV